MHWLFFIGLILSSPVLALSPEAEEFMAITRELEPRLKAGDENDLAAISRQQREAFYRCE